MSKKKTTKSTASVAEETAAQQTPETGTKRLALLERDAWLHPVEHEVNDRYNRYRNRRNEIEQQFGSLYNFANAHLFFGIHYDKKKKGWWYREWAPNAYGLFLTGDFNQWNRSANPMTKTDGGVWEIFLPEKEYKDTFTHGSKIKLLVHAANGWIERIPAYIRRIEQDKNSPNFSGVVWFEKEFDWSDDKFDTASVRDNLTIYESHVGMAQEKLGVGTFMEYAEHILPRIKKAGYNAVQLMAIAEHPYYGSFGYHVSNFFAVTSRCGTPEELKYLIKKAHSMGMAVIMDIVHSHTVKNYNEGLNDFDGSNDLYFHPGARGHHPAWDSKLFDYGKTEVIRFLLSNVRYWIEEFHFDGFRFDGVTSMLYFHHGLGVQFDHQNKFFKEWVEYDAITYLQLANTLVHEMNPGAISIAEDVSGMPGLTDSPDDGGIGFDFRLAMGLPDYWVKMMKQGNDEKWSIHDMYDALTNRKWDVKTVAYVESHDQAMVGDKTVAFWLMDKEMYYSMHKQHQNLIIDRGIALHKMVRLITIALGGDGWMNFMGNEFGHPEWIDFPREGNGYSYWYARRQWSLMDNHDLRYHYLGDFDSAMIHMVIKHKILSAPYPTFVHIDDWHKTISFERGGLIFVFNWHINQSPFDYQVPVPHAGTYRVILNSDNPAFGGFHRVNDSQDYYTTERDGTHYLKIYAPNRAALVFEKQ